MCGGALKFGEQVNGSLLEQKNSEIAKEATRESDFACYPEGPLAMRTTL
jgi:hypothetical protein